MSEPATNKNTNPGTGAPNTATLEAPVKQKIMEASPVSSLAQVDTTKPLSIQEQALIRNSQSPAPITTGTTALDYKPGQFQQHKTFTVPKNWGLHKIAKHLKVTVQALIDSNPDKVHYTGDTPWFGENVAITVPPQNKQEEEAAVENLPQEEVTAYVENSSPEVAAGSGSEQVAESETTSSIPTSVESLDATTEEKQEEEVTAELPQEEAVVENLPQEEVIANAENSSPEVAAGNGSEQVAENVASASTPASVESLDATPEEKQEEEIKEDPEAENKLVIIKGELSKIGEGTKQYIHWPETDTSGVTIGMGYDIGGRKAADVKTELIEAGLDETKARLISVGAEKKGSKAEDFVKLNKAKVGKIDYEIIFNLYNLIVGKYESSAKALATSSRDTNSYTAIGQEEIDNVEEGTYKMSSEQWDALHPAMIELLTDLKYQGGTYTGERLAAVNKVLVEHYGNHLEQFKAVKDVLEGEVFSDFMDEQSNKGVNNSYETFYGEKKGLKGEHRRSLVRIAYLDHIISAMESGKEVVVDADISKLQNTTKNTSGNKQTADYLGSCVGKISNYSGSAYSKNLPDDVKTVQYLLLKVGVLDQASYDAELASGTEVIPEDKLPKTIAAILKYQQVNLNDPTIYGYILPDKTTIRALSGDRREIEKKERRIANKITSIVGDQILDDENVNEDTPAINLLYDVKIIQANLIRLGLMEKSEGDAEPVDPTNSICPSDLSVTIDAIKYFQEAIVGQAAPTGYIEPSDTTHIQLIDISSDEFKREEAVYTEKKAEEERIQQFKDTPCDKESVLALIKTIEEENLNQFLKDYALYNLDFIIQLIDSTNAEEKYYYTTHVIDALSNAELNKLPEDLNNKFYVVVSSQDDFEGNIKYMARFDEGRDAFGLNDAYLTKEDEKSDKEKEEKDKAKKKLEEKKQEAKKEPKKNDSDVLTGSVGVTKDDDKKPFNKPNEIAYIQKLLNSITYTENETKIKYLEDSDFNNENPNKIPKNLFVFDIEKLYFNKPEKPIDFKASYPKTYEAINKFQKKEFGNEYGRVITDKGTINKLVALSNQAKKIKEKEAEKTQEDKKESAKDTKEALTGKVGKVAKPDEKTNLSNNIRYVQKLLNNITDKKTEKKYLDDGFFNSENPNKVPLPENPFDFDFDWMTNNKPEESSFSMLEEQNNLQEIISFDQKYSATYNAIIKFQTDYKLEVDGEIWPGYSAINKLVALSNQATKNKEREAEKIQEDKKESAKDTKEALTGKVGKVAKPDEKTNLSNNIHFVQKLLNNITDKKTEKKYLDDGFFNSENPNKVPLPENPFDFDFDWMINNKPEESSFSMLEEQNNLQEIISFDQKYSATYNAIIKFQTDYKLEVDGEIWPGYSAIKKLVVLSNQATKNKEREAEKKQKEKTEESAKDPTTDNIESLTGTVGPEKDESIKPLNKPSEIAFVQKLLNSLSYIEETTDEKYPPFIEEAEKKYLDDGAFNREKPIGIPSFSGFDWLNNNNNPEEAHSVLLEKPKSFIQEYRGTYDAIIKFQEDHCSFGADGVVGAGNSTIKKLVALSNQATKDREIAVVEKEKAAIAKQEAKELDKQIKQAMNSCSEDNYATMLKSNLLNDPKFVGGFITFIGEGESKSVAYKLVRDLMDKTSDRDLVKIDSDLDKILFDTLYANDDIKEDVNYLLRLRKGKKKYEVEGPFSTIDTIIDIDDWRSQGTETGDGFYPDIEGNGTACKYVSEKMVYRHLYEDLGDNFMRATVTKSADGKYEYVVGATEAGHYLSVLNEDKTQYREVNNTDHRETKNYKTMNTSQAALDYLDGYLETNVPVVVGVDHSFNAALGGKTNLEKPGYNEGTTDHFITIVGRGTTEDGKRYYQFYDPGTNWRTPATKDANILVEEKPFHWVGTQPYKAKGATKYKSYHLSMVVMFQKDITNFRDEVNKNVKRTKGLNDDFKYKTDDFKQ